MNDAQKKEYFWENTTIGVQSNFFDIVNLWENSLHDINANENGAYTQTRNTSTIFYCNNKNVRTVYKYVQKLHYNKRASFNNYQKIYVYKEYVVTLHRPYWKAKSFPLKKNCSNNITSNRWPDHSLRISQSFIKEIWL